MNEKETHFYAHQKFVKENAYSLANMQLDTQKECGLFVDCSM